MIPHVTSAAAHPFQAADPEAVLAQRLRRELAEARHALKDDPPGQGGIRGWRELRVMDDDPFWSILVAEPGTPLGNSFVFIIGHEPPEGAPVPALDADRPDALFRLAVLHRAGDTRSWTAQVTVTPGYNGPHPNVGTSGTGPVPIDEAEAFRLIRAALDYTKESGRTAS